MRQRAELASRGIKGLNRYLHVAFAATGLWWNVFWWEWAYFDLEHIVWGWTLNFILIGCICVGISYHWIVAVAAFPILIVFMKAARLLSRSKKKRLVNPTRLP
jgi:hypothetical protein